MPDTFTHIALPALFWRWFRLPIFWPLLLIGCVLPDYFRELTALILPAQLYSAVYPFHSILGALFTSLLISAFFNTSQRKWVFWSLLAGQGLHFLFDAFQGFLCGGTLNLLFPYWNALQFGLFSESHWLTIFYFSLTVFLLYLGFLIFYIRKRKM